MQKARSQLFRVYSGYYIWELLDAKVVPTPCAEQDLHSLLSMFELLIKNDLVARVDGEVVRYQTTPRGVDALWHFLELEEMIAEFREETEEMPTG